MVVGNDASPKTQADAFYCGHTTPSNNACYTSRNNGANRLLLLMKATQAKRVRDVAFLINDWEQKRHLCVQIAVL